MSHDRKMESCVRCEVFKKTIKIFLILTDKLDELKTQLNQYFVHVSENQIACHVGVQVPCIDVLDNNVK